MKTFEEALKTFEFHGKEEEHDLDARWMPLCGEIMQSAEMEMVTMSLFAARKVLRDIAHADGLEPVVAAVIEVIEGAFAMGVCVGIEMEKAE